MYKRFLVGYIFLLQGQISRRLHTGGASQVSRGHGMSLRICGVGTRQLTGRLALQFMYFLPNTTACPMLTKIWSEDWYRFGLVLGRQLCQSVLQCRHISPTPASSLKSRWEGGGKKHILAVYRGAGHKLLQMSCSMAEEYERQGLPPRGIIASQ